MGASYVHHGDAIDYTPVADVAAGEIVVLGAMVGVAKVPIAAGRMGALHVRGVFDFDKLAGVAINAGAKVFLTAVHLKATPNGAAGTTYAGTAVAAAAAGDATVRVRLNQVPADYYS